MWHRQSIGSRPNSVFLLLAGKPRKVRNECGRPLEGGGVGVGVLVLVLGFSGSPWDSYLVDPASSHMLVSKIKPCMSKYKH